MASLVEVVFLKSVLPWNPGETAGVSAADAVLLVSTGSAAYVKKDEKEVEARKPIVEEAQIKVDQMVLNPAVMAEVGEQTVTQRDRKRSRAKGRWQ